MTEPPAAKFNLQFGSIDRSQVVVGDGNTVTQRVGLSPAEARELEGLFAGLRAEVATEPAEVRTEAEAQVTELERALVSEHPDPGRVRGVLRWFAAHAPQMAGAVISVVVHPLVGRVVQSAGTAIADRLAAVIAEET